MAWSCDFNTQYACIKQKSMNIKPWPSFMIHWSKILPIQTVSGTVGTFLFAGGDLWGIWHLHWFAVVFLFKGKNVYICSPDDGNAVSLSVKKQRDLEKLILRGNSTFWPLSQNKSYLSSYRLLREKMSLRLLWHFPHHFINRWWH